MRKRKYRDPEAPEVLEAVLERMRRLTSAEVDAALEEKPERDLEPFQAEEQWQGQWDRLAERIRSRVPSDISDEEVERDLAESIETIEDEMDREEINRRLADPNEMPLPWEEVKKELEL